MTGSLWPQTDTCPSCHASMQGDPIPDEHRHLYSGAHFQRVIGVEYPGVYDGALVWQCPDCGHRWHRFPEGHPIRVRAEGVAACATTASTEHHL